MRSPGRRSGSGRAGGTSDAGGTGDAVGAGAPSVLHGRSGTGRAARDTAENRRDASGQSGAGGQTSGAAERFPGGAPSRGSIPSSSASAAPTAGAPRLDRPLGHAEHLGGLGDPQAVHVDEDEGESLPFGQLRQRRSDVERGLGRGVVVVPVGEVEGVVLGQWLGRPPAAEPVEACVDDDAVQPRRHGGLAPERVGPPERREEPVLNRVGGHLAVAAGPDGHGPHPVAVPAEQLAERVRVARAVRGDELGVGTQPPTSAQGRAGGRGREAYRRFQ